MLYHYQGLAEGGEDVEGSIHASSPTDLAMTMRRQGVRVYEVCRHDLWVKRRTLRNGILLIVLASVLLLIGMGIA